MHNQGARVGALVSLVIALAAVPCEAQSIDSIEINQAIGIQKNNARKYVAGKDTVVRVFLSSPATIDGNRTSAKVMRDGSGVTTLSPRTYDSPTRVVDFLCPSREACGNWAAGNYSFETTVNGTTRSTTGEYRFVERSEMRILAVPVTANYGGTIVPVTDNRWKTFASYLKRVYPVADDKLIWVVREDLDASDLDLETDKGRLELWERLEKLIPGHCATNPKADGCFQQVFGFIMDRPNGYPNGTLQGYTYGKPANIGVIKDDDAEATVAHEIGHTYGLGDTYDGGSFHCAVNPAPDGFEGKDFNNPDQKVKCTDGRVPLEGVGGTKINAEAAHPYEVGGRGALPDTAEYMGSGGRQDQFWTTQDAYDRMFDQLEPAPVMNNLRAGVNAVPQRFIEAFGLIRQQASTAADVMLDPWWEFDAEGSLPDTTGKFMIAAANASGTRLAARAFFPNFDPPGPKGLPSEHVDPAPFELEMPFPRGTTKFQIIRDGNVVREIPVTANAPVVSKVAPQLVGTQSGVTMITWEASDADGGPLTYSIEYNRDVTDEVTSDWEVVARDLTERQYRIDFGNLAGGPHAKIRVIASDGLNGNDAESGEFPVPFKAPDVFIDENLSLQSYRPGSEIILDGEAEDLQEEISDSQLVWSSNISGVLGRGAPLVVDSLPAGIHTITLTATNSEGRKGQASVRIVVGNSSRKRATRRG